MANQISPPPNQNAIANSVGLPSPTWAKWLQQLWDRFRGSPSGTGRTVPTAITATSVSSTTDFGALQVGDLVLILPASAGNSLFVTVTTAGTLPIAAVVGSLYVVLRSF